MVIYLPYIHAISKKYQTPVSILVKENSRANQLLAEDRHIKEIFILDRTKNNTGTHDGLLGFFKLSRDLKLKEFDKVFIFNSSLRYLLISKIAAIKNISQYPLFRKKDNVVFILWGRKAQEKCNFINKNNHLVLESAHPSPFSAHNGFFGSKPFSKTNNYLKQKNIEPIDWQL